MSDWIDVSVSIRAGMPHWPNTPPIVVERVADIAHGAPSNDSWLSLGVHTGTHVDAPSHLVATGATVEALPLGALVGPARIIEIVDETHVTVAELEAADIQLGERILLKTRNSPRAWQADHFVEDAVHLSVEAAHWLAARRIQTVGIDYLSVGGYQARNGRAVHEALIAADIVIIEGLDLTHAPAGRCDLVCLPLKLAGCDGAPARVIVRPGS